MWERELELIERLGKLYPIIYYDIVEYKNWQKTNYEKSRWVCYLCMGHLEQRLPRLEEFIKENARREWQCYKQYFEIIDEQCGKKS